MRRKILIMGLPGAGKTTLTKLLAPMLRAVVFNADEVRANVNQDLGFSHADRIEHARRMGWLCDRVVASGGVAIADFICPTPETRAAFGDAFVVWVDRLKVSRFADTNNLFEPPLSCDVRVAALGSAQFWAETIAQITRSIFDPQSPTALFVGRFQPFHDGHRRLIEEGLRRVGQACIAVRDTHKLDESNPLGFFDVKQRIESALIAHLGRFIVTPIPNVTHIFYGRDVGYCVERINLDDEIEAISATTLRNQLPPHFDPGVDLEMRATDRDFQQCDIRPED